jgi:hypothetical protein
MQTPGGVPDKMPKRAAAAYEKLADRLSRVRPECEGVDLFTADDLDADDMFVLELICAQCPLRAPCRQYASEGKPTAGYWAGYYRRPRKPYRPRRKGTIDATA